MKTQIYPDKEKLACAAAELIRDAAQQAIEARGKFTLAISGGSTPARLLEILATTEGIDWNAVHLFQVDERIAPDGHDDRNATMLQQRLLTDAFLEKHQPNVWLMPVNEGESESTYQQQLEAVCGTPAALDMIQLGLGGDGHTASLVPNDPVCDVVDRDIATSGLYQGRNRLTMTRPILERTRQQVWLVAGESKQVAIQQLLDRDPAIPANLFAHTNATLLCDEDAMPDN